MAKNGKGKDEKTLRRELAEAQAKLESAQHRRTQVIREGEVAIEKARRKVATRLEKATRRVEQRAGTVAKAESRLYTFERKRRAAREGQTPAPETAVEEVISPETADDLPAPNGDGFVSAESAAGVVVSPDDAANRLQDIEAEVQEGVAAEDIVLPATTQEAEEPGPASGPGRYELRLLEALRSNFTADGATFTDWLAAAQLSKRTFLRSRQFLVEHGLVERSGEGQGAQYRLSPAGAEILSAG